MRPRPTVDKRRKELARQEKQRQKAERRDLRRAEKAQQVAAADGEDPDIAGIVPGPQPPPAEFADLDAAPDAASD